MSDIAARPRKRRSGFAEFVSTIFWAIVIALVVQVVLVQSFTIPSASMEPTVEVGDYVFVNKYAYGYSRYSFSYGVLGLDNGVIPFSGRILVKYPKRGEIAVFRNPKQLGVDFIKRVIGLPGDKIQVKQGVLQINGSPVERTFEKDVEATDGRGQHVPAKQYTETLSNGVSYHIWKMTDEGNANNTPVYEVPADQFFVMGDNRDNSEDSRFSELGFIPADNLIGRAWMVYFNHTGTSPVWQVWDWNTTVGKDRIFKIL